MCVCVCVRARARVCVLMRYEVWSDLLDKIGNNE